jgi:hypothetical protein
MSIPQINFEATGVSADLQFIGTVTQTGTAGPDIARINSPQFTGIPTAPTAAQGNNSAQIATTAYVDALAGALGGNQAVTQTGHGFTKGQAVSLGSSTYVLAKADNINTLTNVGVVADVTANTFTVQRTGTLTGLLYLVPGMSYYVSAVTAGEIVAFKPISNAHFVQPIMTAINETSATVAVGTRTAAITNTAKFGTAVGNDQISGTVTYKTDQNIADAKLFLKTFSSRRIRVAMPSYNNASAITAMRQLVLLYKSLGCWVDWGVTGNRDQAGQTNAAYADWLAQVDIQAAWAYANGVDRFHIGNEEGNQANIGAYGTKTLANVIADVKAKYDYLRPLYPNMELVYSDAQGSMVGWTAAGFGNIDKIGFNVYDNVFPGFINYMYNSAATADKPKLMVTEWAAPHPHYWMTSIVGWTDAQYAADLAARYNVLNGGNDSGTVFESYFFGLRYGGNGDATSDWNILKADGTFKPGAKEAFGGGATATIATYVNKAGDTMTGQLTINNGANTDIANFTQIGRDARINLQADSTHGSFMGLASPGLTQYAALTGGGGTGTNTNLWSVGGNGDPGLSLYFAGSDNTGFKRDFYIDVDHTIHSRLGLFAPTAATSTNTTQVATTAFVTNAVNSLVNSSPAALDTLNELAAALGNDANFSTTVTNSLASKGQALNPTAIKTAAYTAVANDFVPVDTTSNPVTITLPTAPVNGTRFGAKMIIQGGTNTVTITAGGSDVFNKASGSTSVTLTLLNQSIQFQYNSGIWYGVSSDIGLTALDARYQGLSTNLTAFAAKTAPTGTVVGTSDTQTLTGKTLTSPAITTPTGLVKGDVGLGNVDNTSDATKNSATATLTNKTLTSPVINTPTGITKSDVGLGNVDNTSDATKLTVVRTLTNARITPRTGTATSSATPTINTDNVDFYSLTAQAVAITSMTTNLTGTPTEAQRLWIAITGTAAQTIAWGTSFENGATTLPTTTVGTTRLDIGLIWNSVTSKWRCMASG